MKQLHKVLSAGECISLITVHSPVRVWLSAHLPAGVLGAALLHGPGGDDVEALHHHRPGQQRRQVLGVGLWVLVHPAVVTHVHQDLPWWDSRGNTFQHVSWRAEPGRRITAMRDLGLYQST